MRSLDEFNRYIEKNREIPEGGIAPPSRSNGNKAAVNRANRDSRDETHDNGRMRYVLRGGITIAIPIDEEDHDASVADSAPVVLSTPRLAPEASVGFSSGQFPLAQEAEDGGSGGLGLAGPNGSDAQMWQRLPRHLQLLIQLADSQETEAAQKYYTRGFKESRRQLIERLLDPTLTLEDTARVLGVVPTTVRRYTNRGVLTHHRTVGQQRRFKLSDVLSFLEAQQAGRIADLDGDDSDESDGED